MLCMTASTKSNMGMKSLYPGAIALPVFSVYMPIYPLQSYGINATLLLQNVEKIRIMGLQ